MHRRQFNFAAASFEIVSLKISSRFEQKCPLRVRLPPILHPQILLHTPFGPLQESYSERRFVGLKGGPLWTL